MAFKLSLPSWNIGLLSPNLKVGVILGMASVSAASGVLTVAMHVEDIKTQFNPIGKFLSDKWLTFSGYLINGSKNLISYSKSWSSLTFSKVSSFYEWLKNNLNFENWKKGFDVVSAKLPEYLRTAGNFVVNKFDLTKLNFQKIRKYIYQISRIYTVIKRLRSIIFEALKDETKREKIMKSLMSIINGRHTDKFFAMAGGLITEYPQVFDGMSSDDASEAMSKFSENPEEIFKNYLSLDDLAKGKGGKEKLTGEEIKKHLFKIDLWKLLWEKVKKYTKAAKERVASNPSQIQGLLNLENSSWFSAPYKSAIDFIAPCSDNKCNGTNTTTEWISALFGG